MMNDAQLLAGIARQNHKDFAEFVSRYMQTIMNYIHRYIPQHDQVEDIAQDVFLKVWQHATDWRPQAGGSPRAWLYRIAYNHCMDVFRKEKDFIEHEGRLENTQTPETILSKDNQQEQLKQAITGLPERQRTALYLCSYQGLSNKEAAQIMSISVEALESLLSRARRYLRAELVSMNEAEKDELYTVNE